MGRLAVLALVISVVGSYVGPLQIDSQVAEAGRRAMIAEMIALVLPSGVQCPPDDAGWIAVQRQVREVIDAAFAEPARGRLLEALLRPELRSACTLAGGVDIYEPGSTAINHDLAFLTARVGIWNRAKGVDQTPPSEPHNVIDADFRFVRSGSHWLVSDYRWTFVPGHGP